MSLHAHAKYKSLRDVKIWITTNATTPTATVRPVLFKGHLNQKDIN